MRVYRSLIIAACLGALLSACGTGESNVAAGNKTGFLHYGNGAEPQGLDPHVVTGVPESHIVRALFEGLAVKNPITLESEPGVAERWAISEDGRVYTFYINPEAKWSNGEAMTASDYVWSWNRALHPDTGSLYAYMLYPIVNSEAYSKREITDFGKVGVKALDDLTLQVTLNEPTPYFLQLMDHYSTFAVHPETLLKHGKMTDRYTPWTRVGNMVSNGPFTLEEWSLNRRIIVEKSDHYWDRDNVSLNGVYFYPTENLVSEERMFRAEQLHFTQTVPLDKIPAYRERENSPYVQAPYLGTYYYLINTDRPPVDDARVRKALSFALDRDKLTNTVLQNTAIPAYSITPPNTLGYYPPKLFEYDIEEARRLLAEAGYPNGEGWPGLEIVYNTQEAHRKVAVAIQQMWKEALNIDITISNQEWKVYLNTISQRQFQVARRGWIGDYVDANNFLDLFLTDGGNNNTGYSDPVFDDIILNRAPKAKSREERYQLFYEAETMLLEEMPFIPIYTYTSKHLVHPSVEGIYPNLMDSLNLKYVKLDPERSLDTE
ncbi:MAG: peptide ABC transporter substrate-binding protein [Halieaceae bacterium MED-G27]|jgi:oligopeptide transport system substrate-binding protein|nr:peptide ABC transporter substrate-binding protein [Halieaceae bacterium]OUT64856.1 MAG: peptide ABC transporter substrate-binding protein [Cellvibrionales bacterium TMED21]PDH35795.1 MAG: peptide ABC transporter substrate-binding protein [Halieaceae bacterium MED-G27]|tara:strand:- start:1509 stop:3146 length:1638 start_codon:yes stop_codon:yes gene_type:complete